jgi:hypothetical protein
MASHRIFCARLFKISLLVSLLMVVFLLYSSFFLSPDLPMTANLIQTVSFIISSPYLLLENTLGSELGWFPTALLIFFFWFTIIYTIFVVSKKIFIGRKMKNSYIALTGKNNSRE